MVLDELNNLFVNVFVLLADFVVEVRTVERGDEHFGLVHAEVFLDVALHLGRGGGRQRNHGHILADLLDDFSDVAVFGTEVVAPFGDAVRLVDGVKRDVDILEKVHVFLFGQGFRCDIQQFGLAGDDVIADFGDLGLVERGVQEVRNASVGSERADGVNLVLHQCNQRGDDDGCALAHQCRKLIAHGLAAAGGHNHETILSLQQRLDDFQLVALERFKAEDRFQRLINSFIRNSLHAGTI